MKRSSSSSQGAKSKNVRAVGVRTGQTARKINEKGVSQIGTNRSNHATDHSKTLTRDQEPLRFGHKPMGSPGTVELGNECSLQSAGSKANPGSGRTVYGQSGSQSSYSGQAMPPTVKTQAKY